VAQSEDRPAFDAKYYKSLGLVQFYEKNYLESIFSLQKASALSPSDQEVVKFLKMNYDSIGNKDLAGKMRLKLESFSSTTIAPKPTLPAPTINNNNNSISTQKSVSIPAKAPTIDLSNDLMYMGHYYFEKESYDSCALCYKKHLLTHANDTVALYYLATAQYFLKEYDNAIENYERILKLDKKRADIYNWIGVCHMQENNFLAARDYFRQSLRYDKDYAFSYYNLGKAQYELEDYGSAVKNLQTAELQMPNDLDIKTMLADVYLKMGDLSKAQKIFERLYTTNKKSERINYVLGDIYLQKKEYQNAVNYLENFVVLVPNSIESFKELGIAYYGLENYTVALVNFEKAAAVLFDDKDLMLFTGITANQTKDYTKALDYLNRAQSLDSKMPRIYYQMGVAFKGLKKYKLAHQNFEKAKELEDNLLVP
jgi:tetratricopeptide (TPR) repeat protein